MGLFTKKADPISDRARQLNAQIAELESRIQQLNQRVEPENPRRFRSTAYPTGVVGSDRAAQIIPQSEPVFERVDRKPLKEPPTPGNAVRNEGESNGTQFDPMEILERLKRHFQGPAASNPKLVNYLAAGNIQGLRPLRYEKRVARNRFMGLTFVLVLVLFGLFCFLAQRR